MFKKLCIKYEAVKMTVKNTTLGVSRKDAGEWAIVSLGTARTFCQTYVNFLKWCDGQEIAPRSATHQDGKNYLITRTLDLCQATLNRERIALQHHFKKRFKCYVSLVPLKKKMPRRYAYGEAIQILMRAGKSLGISILISLMAGVRACELLTIAPVEDQPESVRPWLAERFLYLQGCRAYTVKGKGGLVRTVMLPLWLSVALETCRLPTCVRKTDRGIYRESRYDIPGGKNFSNQFSKIAKKVLGFSRGAHGLRGTYAQIRLTTLVKLSVPFEKARLIVAQELGHFSPANLRYYLPGSCFHKFLLKGGRCELKAHDQNELSAYAEQDWHTLANASILH